MRFFFLTAFLLLGLTVSFGQGSVQVIAEKANIRSSPNAKAAVVATVMQEESLELLESRGAWHKVKTPNYVGWIHGNAVSVIASRPLLVLPRRYGDPDSKWDIPSDGPGSGGGIGTGRGQGTGTGGQAGGTPPATVSAAEMPLENEPANAQLRLLYMPKPAYTEIARKNQVQGTVRLKVTFLASGQIGAIVPITSLPDGLTDKAVEVAKLIRFKPQRVNGVPRTVVKSIEYNFSVY